MKRTLPLSIAACALLFAATDASAQTRVIDGGGSSGINVIPKTDPKKVTKKVKTVQLVAISPERVWKSADKKKNPIIGSLLAFAREAKTGKVLMIREDKIRLLVGKKDFTVPLSKLSADDQSYVRKLEDSARIAGKLLEPPKKAEKKKAVEKKKPSAEKKEPVTEPKKAAK